MLKKLFRDERGIINSVDYLFMTCVVAIAGLVGVATLRDQVAQEAADVGLAVDQLDQSFLYVVPGVGYDPDVPFDPNNPVGYYVAEFNDPDANNPDGPPNPLSFPAASGSDSDISVVIPMTDSN